jgi:hypothetical protein
MSTQDAMTIDERYKYLCCMRKRYRHANRKGRGCLLDEMQAVTGLHRKSLIRLMNSSLTRKPRTRERVIIESCGLPRQERRRILGVVTSQARL